MAKDEVPESIRKAFDPKAAQADMADIVLEDPQLEKYLRDVFEHEEAAAKYRVANKGIKTRMLEDHGSAINSDDDGTHSGYVRVGGFRFKPRYGTREAVTREVTYGAGKDWEPLEISRLV